MTTIGSIWAPSGSTSGQRPRLHASVDGKRTLCGRVVGEYWNPTPSSWDKWVAIDAAEPAWRPSRLCERCQQAAAKATR